MAQPYDVLNILSFKVASTSFLWSFVCEKNKRRARDIVVVCRNQERL